MADQESYPQRANPVFEAEMALRTASQEAAFFLPFLRPGMRVLDRATFLKAQLQGFAPTALAEGWMDQTIVEAVVAEIDARAGRPDALYVETFCEAVGWVSD